MNKDWDDNKGGRDNWINWLSNVMTEAKRVLKFGGHSLVWALPRTSHWTGFALENAGFEVRDCIYHLFGSGFPKSMDISKAIDKIEGVQREKIIATGSLHKNRNLNDDNWNKIGMEKPMMDSNNPITPDAKKWNGWGTSLKPAVEVWWLARKPIGEKTVAENVLKWGTGGINIDECRIPTSENLNGGAYSKGEYDTTNKVLELGLKRQEGQYKQPIGRFPANLIHDGSDVVLKEFEKYGESESNIRTPSNDSLAGNGITHGKMARLLSFDGYTDNGSPARFFYCAKASKNERDTGIDGMYHPTVKSLALMEYLIKLITPPNGIVLDMFAGSGSTLVASKKLCCDFIGIEINSEYCKIAQKRLAYIPNRLETFESE
jgi:site-specific DNA-methyltransferase (adenine-specific)